jgi:hypothetical protein
VEKLFWKTCAGTAPSLRCIGRLQRSVLIKNGRSWRKHLSMSVSQGRSSKDTLLFAIVPRDGRWQPLRKPSKASNVGSWSELSATAATKVDGQASADANINATIDFSAKGPESVRRSGAVAAWPFATHLR